MTTATAPSPTVSPEILVEELRAGKYFFDRSTDCLLEEHSGFAPAEGMMTVAQQVAHVAHTYDWFVEGTFRPEGFNLDFEDHDRAIGAITSLAEARKWLDTAVEAAVEAFGSRLIEELMQPLPEGPVMGGKPRLAVVGALADHTAHHRGTLTVYSRLQGLVPKMPYGDM